VVTEDSVALVSKEKREYLITDDEAHSVYKSLMDFYDTFETIEEYSLLKKREHNMKFGTRTDMMGTPLYSDKLFDDYTMRPEDMNFRLEVVDDNERLEKRINIHQGGPKKNDVFNVLLNLTSSHSNVAVPGRQMRVIVYETTSNKIVGFIRVNSPTLNMKPRANVFGCKLSDEYSVINDNMIVGTIIVPTQPFGYNYLGGKLLALIANSNQVRGLFDQMYGTEIKYFETTSLYGSIKGVSQYDGLKPYMRNGGLTESALIPIPTQAIVKEFYKMFKRFRHDGELFGISSGSVKLKKLTKIYSLVLNRLKEIDPDKHDSLKAKMDDKRHTVTTKKLYYWSAYGVANVKEFIIDHEDPKFNINMSRFNMDSMVDWWKKKAQKRYDKLLDLGTVRHEVELWTEENIDSVKFQIIR